MRCHVNKASAKQAQLVNQGHTWGKGVLEKGCTQGHANSNTSHRWWRQPVSDFVARSAVM
jgi:hypothetical protein